jgi:hypothetical protein
VVDLFRHPSYIKTGVILTPTNIKVIKWGTYAGECLVYCNQEITLTTKTIGYSLTSKVPDANNPDIKKQSKNNQNDWSKLINALDLQAFLSLQPKIGDPDAADQGGEFIAISFDSKTHRVDFVREREIPEISAFLDVLRAITTKISDANRK